MTSSAAPLKSMARTVAVCAFACLRWVGVAIPVVAALTGKAAWCWASLPFLSATLWSSIFVHIAYRRNLSRIPRLESPPPWPEGAEWPSVALVVAARNEERGIETAVRSFMASDHPRLTVIIVDDHSTDATPGILDKLAAEFPRLRVVHDPPRQEGWAGKGNAVWHAVHNLVPEDCEWVLSTDADVRLAPGAVGAGVAHAESLGVDYLTCVPCLEPETLSEEFGIMTASWSLAIAGALHRPESAPRAIGLGVFALFTRDVYVKSGGHTPFQASQPEDMKLAGVIHEAGGKTAVGWTSGMVRVRHLVGYEEVRRTSITKMRIQLGDSIPAILGVAAYWLARSVLPLPLAGVALASHPFSFPVALFATLQFAVYVCESTRFAAQRRFVTMRWFAPWLHPLAGLMRLWFTVVTVWQILTGKPIAWRGRTLERDASDG